MRVVSIYGDFACPICTYKLSYEELETEIINTGFDISNEHDNYEDYIRCSSCSCCYEVQADVLISLHNLKPADVSKKERIVRLKRRVYYYFARRRQLPCGLVWSRVKHCIYLIREIQKEIKKEEDNHV
jgi:hypothetical protein